MQFRINNVNQNSNLLLILQIRHVIFTTPSYYTGEPNAQNIPK